MRRILFVVLLTLAASAPALGQGSAEQQIRDLEKQSLEAAERGTGRAFGERYLADDFLFTDPMGGVMTKAQILARAKSTPGKGVVMEVDDQQVRVYGDTAVVTGRVTFTSADNPKPDSRPAARYTRVWVNQGGSWKLVAEQLTRIAAPAVR